MRKGSDGGETGKNRGKKRGKKEKTDENSGHYVIASSRRPERRLLERRTLAPKRSFLLIIYTLQQFFLAGKDHPTKNQLINRSKAESS